MSLIALSELDKLYVQMGIWGARPLRRKSLLGSMHITHLGVAADPSGGRVKVSKYLLLLVHATYHAMQYEARGFPTVRILGLGGGSGLSELCCPPLRQSPVIAFSCCGWCSFTFFFRDVNVFPANQLPIRAPFLVQVPVGQPVHTVIHTRKQTGEGFLKSGGNNPPYRLSNVTSKSESIPSTAHLWLAVPVTFTHFV